MIAAELAVAVFLEMFQRERAGDDFAPGIGFAFGLLLAGFERLQLGVELVAFLPQEFEPVGGGLARHRSFCDSGNWW